MSTIKTVKATSIKLVGIKDRIACVLSTHAQTVLATASIDKALTDKQTAKIIKSEESLLKVSVVTRQHIEAVASLDQQNLMIDFLCANGYTDDHIIAREIVRYRLRGMEDMNKAVNRCHRHGKRDYINMIPNRAKHIKASYEGLAAGKVSFLAEYKAVNKAEKAIEVIAE